MSNDLLMNRTVSVLEHVTPYKICVTILIQEYCLIKTTVANKNQAKRALFGNHMKPQYKREFCMLALLLSQSPDIEYFKLMELLDGGKYTLQSELVDNFKKRLNVILDEDVGCVFDIFSNIDRLTDYAHFEEPLIQKSSKIGVYVRRVRLFFDKLSFDETVKVYTDLQEYIREGNNRSGGGEKGTREQTLPADSEQRADFQPAMDLDFSSIQVELSTAASELRPPPLLEHSLHHHKGEGGGDGEQQVGLWSKQQVDVFVTDQARYLVNEPARALPPNQLQNTLNQILTTSNQHVDAHYLSYLNCVRSKEVNGAVSSLYHFFDRKSYMGGEEDRRTLRLAALNLAIMHTIFNRKKEALCALNEAVTLAHEANDSITLQYCQTWLHILNNENREEIFEKSLAKCEELNLTYLLTFSYQAFAQSSHSYQSPPAQLFELLNKSEVLDSVREIAMIQRAALWSLYGQPDLASLCAQRLLSLASPSSPSVPVALAILIQHFALRGEYEEGMKVLEEGRSIGGKTSLGGTQVGGTEWLVLSEGILSYTEALHKGHWQHTTQAIRLIALVDNTEATIRSCEVMLAKGDKRSVQKLARGVVEDGEGKATPVSRVRALRLLAQCDRASAQVYLARALVISTAHYLHFYRRLILFDILAKHVELGQGELEIEGWGVLSSCSYCHVSDCLVIHAKARVLAAAASGTSLHQELAAAVRILDRAQHYARSLQDYARLKNIAYLQAVLCDNIGLITDRNRYSFQFRTLDEQFPSYNASLSL